MTDEKLPPLVSDAFAASTTRAGGPYVVCIPFPIGEDTVHQVLARPDFSGIITPLPIDGLPSDRVAKPVSAYSAAGKPDHPCGAVPQLCFSLASPQAYHTAC